MNEFEVFGSTAATATRPSRRGRPWRFKSGLYKGLLALSVATFLGTGMLISPIGVSPVAAVGSGDIDQCANDPAPSPSSNGCATSASDWVNGNLNASKSVFLEGDSIPYRIKLSDIPTDGTTVTVTIEWDTTKSGKHAIDYITDWNESVLNANPCLGVASCDISDFDTFPIPVDPQVSGAGVTQIPGDFALFGGTIVSVSPYFYSTGTGFAGDKSAGLTLTITGTVSDPVLAWGGHIATRQDWGQNNSAVAITGSPYHTRIIEVGGSGGNQDRSLKEDAVIFPSSITIIKQVPGTDPQNFAFTASGGLLPASFTLDDDADGTFSNTQVFSNITTFATYTFAETLPSGWQLNDRQCVVTGEDGGSTSNSGANAINVALVEGQDVTCTFFNGEIPNPSLNVTKTAAEASVDAAGDVINYTIVVTNTGNVPLTGVSIDDPLLSNEDCDGVPGAPFVKTGFNIAVGGSLTCTGTYTVTQADIDNNGGGDGDIDNTVTADSNETGPDTASEDVPIVRNASLNVTKTAAEANVDAAGDVINYTITVFNTGNVTLTGVSIDDPLLSNEDCDGVPGAPFVKTGFTIAVGGSLACTGTYTVTQADIDNNGGGDGDIDNTVTADSNETGPDTADAAVPILRSASLNVTKTATSVDGDNSPPFLVDAVGDVITYSISVQNTGNVTLTGVSIDDPLLSNEDCDGVPGAPFVTSGFTIAVGGSLTCTGTYAVTQADLDNNGGGDGDIDNIVTADSNETPEDTDEEAVPLTRSPSLDVTKTAAEASVDAAGDVIHYTITVFNTGNVTLTGVSVNDPLLDNEDCDGVPGAPFVSTGFTINVGGSLTCTGSYAVTQADIDNNGGGDGDIDNTVTADSNETGPDTASEDVPIIRNPALNVVKTATGVDADTTPPFAVDAAGDVITYSIVVTNTGNVTLTGVSVNDPLLSNEDCDGVPGAPFVNTGFTINVGGSLTCSGTYTVTQADIDNNGGGDGDIDNIATADSNETGPDTDEEAVPVSRTPSLDVVKTAVSVDDDNSAPFLVDEAGDVITYSIVVTNTGNTTLTGVSVNDPLLSNEDCDGVPGAPFVNTGFTINVGGSLTCTGSYTVTQADIDNNGGGDGDIDNIATADSNETGPDTDEEAVPLVRTPSLSIEKVATESSFDSVGDVIHYTITVTNTGNTTLTNVAVTDAQVADLDCDGVAGAPLVTTGFTINVGGSLTCTASHTITQADLDDGHYFNQACADDGAGGAEQDCDDVDTPGDQTPMLDIDKTVVSVDGDNSAPFLVDEAGDVISYSILVTNTGNVTLTGVSVSDPLLANLDCSAAAGLQTSGFTLAPGATLTCTGTYAVTQADIDDNGGGDGDIDNTATADSDQTGPDTDSETVPLAQIDLLAITKVATESGYDSVGDVINYTITATNAGNTTLHNVVVTDDQVTDLVCVPATPVASLAPGASITCTASHTIVQADIDAGSFFNQACVDDGSGDGDTGADEICDDVTTPGEQNPALSITKIDDDETFDSVGDVINYTITATNTGNVTLHDVVVTDAQVTDLVCVPALPVASLAPGASITCTASHTVTQADLDAGSFFNEACVDDGNGDGDTGANEICDDVDTPGDQNPELSIVKIDDDETFDSVGDVIHYTITATNTGNVTLTNVVVTDDQVTDLMCLPALPVASLAPGASITCVASHTVTQADIDAGSFFNEACVDDGEGGAAEICDDVDTPGDQNPELSITKVAAEGIFTAVGQVIHYTITATNTGNVTLHDVVVTDAQVTDLVCEPALPVASLAVGATITCTASHTIVQADLDAGFFFNEACVDDGEGGAAEVCDDVTVPGQQAGGETDIPTQPPTDGSLGGGGHAGPAGSAWLLVIGLGILLAITVLLTPNRKRKEVVQETQDR